MGKKELEKLVELESQVGALVGKPGRRAKKRGLLPKREKSGKKHGTSTSRGRKS